MGVNITTDYAVSGLLIYSNGFTNGDPQTSKEPTAFDSGWANSVTLEIDYAIAWAATPTYSDSSTSWMQLGPAIHEQITNYNPRYGVTYATSYRSHESAGLANNWREWKRTSYLEAATQGTTQTICSISDVPNDSQFWVTFHGCVVQTDSLTTYSNIVLRCSCRKTGGTVTVQKTSTVDSDGALAVTWSVVNSSGGPALRAQLPAAPGKTFNFAAHGLAFNVTRI